jgi:hypothetical protein
MILYHVGVTLLVIWFVMRGNTRVDYRIAAFGAILPDLIDKPIGRILFRERFESGRLWGHTLLFNVALLCVLFFLRGRRKRVFTLVPVASLLHLAEDNVWSKPQVFWWPLFGTDFVREPYTTYWWAPWVSSGAMIQEAVGLACLVWLFAAHGMLNRDGMRTFLRTGHLEKETTRT